MNFIEEESLSSDDSVNGQEEGSSIFLLSPKNISTCPNDTTGIKKNPISVFSRKKMAPTQSFQRLPTIEKKPEKEISPKGNKSVFMAFSIKNDIKSNFFHDRTFSMSKRSGKYSNKPILSKTNRTMKSQCFLPATAFKISQNFEPSKMPKITNDEKVENSKLHMKNLIVRYKQVSSKAAAWSRYN